MMIITKGKRIVRVIEEDLSEYQGMNRCAEYTKVNRLSQFK